MSMCSRILENIHVILRIIEADVRGLSLAQPKH